MCWQCSAASSFLGLQIMLISSAWHVVNEESEKACTDRLCPQDISQNAAVIPLQKHVPWLQCVMLLSRGAQHRTKCATVFELQGLFILIFRKLRILCLKKTRISNLGARLFTRTVTNDVLVPEHSRLFRFISGIKSYFCCRAAKLMDFS